MINNSKIEEWRDIEGYKGYYQVSSFGRVKILGRRFLYKNLGYITTEDRIMKSRVKNNGYAEVSLSIDGSARFFLVHRLVAAAFYSNESNLATVNHIDGVRHNNYVENLEWSSYSDNIKHSFKFLRRKPTFQTYKDGDHPSARRIKCTTLDIEFDTIKDVCEKLNVNRRGLSLVCEGKLNSLKGLSFRYIKK